MKALVTVLEARYVKNHRLLLRFSDGIEKTVDFSPWLRGEVFEPLRDVAAFKKFFLSGGTVCWPNGADVAPETLRAAADASASAA
ncbi:MAG: DUF2442 domain-containing protein [Thermoanaerobaculia bacterium]